MVPTNRASFLRVNQNKEELFLVDEKQDNLNCSIQLGGKCVVTTKSYTALEIA